MPKLSLIIALLICSSLAAQEIMILGIGQDAGKPQLGCKAECCAQWPHEANGSPVSLALLDQRKKEWLLFEASPDISRQLNLIPPSYYSLPRAVFLSHAHIGHYTGLMQFGREAANTSSLPVFCGSRMKDFLSNQGPWSQLVALHNIQLKALRDGQSKYFLAGEIEVEVLEVPHRDEFSETLAYLIKSKKKRLLFIPDIDKWERWELDIDSLIGRVDYALLDATFYDEKELPGRDMSEIPHPFVKESMARWKDLPKSVREKIYFIHLNHSNPLWYPDSPESKAVRAAGFQVARPGMKLAL